MSIHRTDIPKQDTLINGKWSQSSQSCDFCGKHVSYHDLYAVKVSIYPHAHYACVHCVEQRKLQLGRVSNKRYIANKLKGQS